MAQIILEIHHSGHQKTEYRKFDDGRIRVGRGFANDVIIPDPYLDEEHIVIFNKDGQWRVEDQESQNGLFVNKAHKRVSAATISSGDVIYIGKTGIRILAPSHRVPLPKRIKSHIPVSNGKLSTLLAIGGVIIIYTLEGYLGTTENVPEFGKLCVWTLFFLFLGVFWSGFWALITRMIKQHSRFIDHFRLTCIFYILIIPLSNLTSLFGYLSSQIWLEIILFFVSSSVLFAFILMGHFEIATHLTRSKRLVFSSSTIISLIAITCLFFFAVKDDFRNIPMLYGTLKPPFYKIFPGNSIDQFLQDNKWVFSRQEANLPK